MNFHLRDFFSNLLLKNEYVEMQSGNFSLQLLCLLYSYKVEEPFHLTKFARETQLDNCKQYLLLQLQLINVFYNVNTKLQPDLNGALFARLKFFTD